MLCQEYTVRDFFSNELIKISVKVSEDHWANLPKPGELSDFEFFKLVKISKEIKKIS